MNRIKNKFLFGRNMSLINFKDGDDSTGVDTSLADFFKAEGGHNLDGGGSDDNSNQDDSTNLDDDQNQDGDNNQSSDDNNQDDSSQDDSDNDNSDDDNNNSNTDDNDQDNLTDSKDDQIARLTSLVEKLTDNKEPKKEEPLPETDPFKTDAFDNLATGMNWDDEEKGLMKDFFGLMLDHNNTSVLQQAQQSIPEIVNSTMSVKEKQAAVKKTFYTDHSALSDVKDYVGLVAQTVAKEFKSLGKSQDVSLILAEAAKRTYKNLNIKQVTNTDSEADNKTGKGKKPAFASNSGARKKAPKLTEDQKMINAISNLDF